MTHAINLYVNGMPFHLTADKIEPRMTLLQFLRQNGYTGTKLGCGEGGCGACTVMVARHDADAKTVQQHSVNACLAPVCAFDGAAITTVEGIGGTQRGLHPVQERIASAHGSQCGFCTPGIVMSVYTQLRCKPQSTPTDIEDILDGNLCRCTGYRPILDAARSLSNNKAPTRQGCTQEIGASCEHRKACEGCPGKLNLPQKAGSCDTTNGVGEVHNCSEKYIQSAPGAGESLLANGQTEPDFPANLLTFSPSSLCIVKNGATWYQPLTMEHLLQLKATHRDARLVVGNTEVGIEVRFKSMEYRTLINPTKVKELKTLSVSSAGVTIGATVTINELRGFIDEVVMERELSGRCFEVRGLAAIRDMMGWFASTQIRNVASIGGNIATASPISDLNPMLMACNAVLNLQSLERGSRQVFARDFFLAYRKVDLQSDEILQSVSIPFATEFEFVVPFKQARRREDDISIVSAGIRVVLTPHTDHWTVSDCTLAYGGMAPVTLCANKTAKALIGKEWILQHIEGAFGVLRKELLLSEEVPGGQAQYRMALSGSFLLKAFLTVTKNLQDYMKGLKNDIWPQLPVIDETEQSGIGSFLCQLKPMSRGEQSYTPRDGIQLHVARPVPHELLETPFKPSQSDNSVGKPVMHRSAESQVTGEARYTDDIPLPANAVHACLVTSTRAHAKILSVDLSQAKLCPGYVAYLSAKDVVGSNLIGPIQHDEELFVEDIAKHYGATIGVIIADTHEQARHAASKVQIEYKDLPPVITIPDAIAAGSFYPQEHGIITGNIEQARKDSDILVKGTFNAGGQEHFYLETNCAKAIPLDNDHLEVFASSQNCAEVQSTCATVCSLPAARVVVRCKRMGGAFGGKESRATPFACTVALAARLLNRPVSINIERDVDMSITGQRHAFHYQYEAGCTRDGRLTFLQAKIYSNGGSTLDLSQCVMDRALQHADNVYRWPALNVQGRVCRTNQASHTAFRGFGSPQAMMLSEIAIEHLARRGNLAVDVVRDKNLYQEGEETHFGTRLTSFYVPRLLEDLSARAQVAQRRLAVEEFNRGNRWKKRGLSVLGTKYGINFGPRFLNQGGALVHVYVDGSVLIAHGGCEMGQGLHTKVIQIAAQCFGIPIDRVTVTETATNTVANASSTAASLSTDLYGMAVLDACEQIVARLKPVQERMPQADWNDLVIAAYFDRVNLSAQGFYVVDASRCGYDWDKVCSHNAERGTPFNYFTQGVACSEVEIDCLTGDSRVLRTDILMDLGKSINPAIDIGQIEGAFMQGFGWCTMEELVWGDSEHRWVRPGQLFTRGPGTYKIPSFNDVPLDFRVHLADTDNRFAVHSSKAVGEPPFFLGCTVFFAILDAIRGARRDNNADLEDFCVDLPATSERIRLGCADHISKPARAPTFMENNSGMCNAS